MIALRSLPHVLLYTSCQTRVKNIFNIQEITELTNTITETLTNCVWTLVCYLTDCCTCILPRFWMFYFNIAPNLSKRAFLQHYEHVYDHFSMNRLWTYHWSLFRQVTMVHIKILRMASEMLVPYRPGKEHWRDKIEDKIASEMPIPHSLGKYFSTPWDIEVVKKYKVQDTFRAVSVILRSK